MIDSIKRIQKQLVTEIPKLSEIVKSVAVALDEAQKTNVEYVDTVNKKIILSLAG